MKRLTSKVLAASVLTCCIGLLQGCQEAANTTSQSAGEAATSDDEVAQQMAAAIKTKAGQEAITALGKQSFADHLHDVAALSSKGDVKIGSLVLPESKTPLSDDLDAYVAGGAPFTDQQDYWDDMGLDPQQITPEHIKEALRMINDFDQQKGGFAASTYANGGGLDANWNRAQGLGLWQFFDKVVGTYKCGKDVLAIKGRIKGTMSAVCEASCLSFWETVNRCREVLKVGIAAEKKAENWVNIGQKIKNYTRLMEIAIKIGPFMERLIGFFTLGRIGPATQPWEHPADQPDNDAAADHSESAKDGSQHGGDAGADGSSKGR